MELVLNQFGVTDTKGRVLNPDKGLRYDVQNAGADALVVGDCVKIKSVAGAKTICVEKIAETTDTVFGMVQYESAGAATYATGKMLTIAADYSIVTCEASTAIAAGAEVEAVIAGQKVATKTTGTAIGIALTPAAAAGDLILVKLG